MKTLGPFSLSDQIEYNQAVYTGDARELGKLVPDHSIDLIWTDPPWDNDSLVLYDWLAEWAARVLKPGGFVAAYAGGDIVLYVLKTLGATGLTWFRQFAGVQMDSNDKYWRHKIFCSWRPIPVFSQGETKPYKWTPDALRTTRDKRFHKWGQGEAAPMRWISCLVGPGSVVVDPFCGGGCTAAVCKTLGYDWLTFEIDESAAGIARQRLMDLIPLPIGKVDQLELFGG